MCLLASLLPGSLNLKNFPTPACRRLSHLSAVSRQESHSGFRFRSGRSGGIRYRRYRRWGAARLRLLQTGRRDSPTAISQGARGNDVLQGGLATGRAGTLQGCGVTDSRRRVSQQRTAPSRVHSCELDRYSSPMGRKEKIFQLAKGYRGRAKNCITTARARVEKGLQYAYRDRRTKKREFRSLWITRVNAGVRGAFGPGPRALRTPLASRCVPSCAFRRARVQLQPLHA